MPRTFLPRYRLKLSHRGWGRLIITNVNVSMWTCRYPQYNPVITHQNILQMKLIQLIRYGDNDLLMRKLIFRLVF